jgi:UDP-N-acetylmuramate--alanine ligase
MEFLTVKNIHFVGLGGIGVSAIARFFAAQGAKVSGSDRTNFDMAKELRMRGIKVFTKHDAKNVPAKTEAIIFSSAVPFDNPELSFACIRGIPCFEYVEALEEIMKEKYGIGVSGTNGKTTTTAMLGKILERAKMDPMVILGGKVTGWDANLRLPTGSPRAVLGKKLPRTALGEELFVAEACEYRRHFLKLSPKAIVLTNIEAEHLDYFRDLSDVKNAFSEYVSKLPKDGFLIYNADDKNVAAVAQKTKAKKVSCSLQNKNADFFATNIRYEKGTQVFQVFRKEPALSLSKGKNAGNFSVGVPGIFNVMNALEALACAVTLGADIESARKSLAQFHGTWRRFEKVGKVGKTVIISDYAHHPAGVRATIQATKDLYPNKKILFVFQPHQKDRTLKLLNEFAEAFEEADNIILSEIYEVAGRNETAKNISSKDIAQKIGKHAIYSPSVKETQKLVKKFLPQFDVAVIMGAGDIYTIANNLVK